MVATTTPQCPAVDSVHPTNPRGKSLLLGGQGKMIKCEKMKEKGKTGMAGMAGSDRSHFFHTGFCGVVTGRDKSSFGYLSFLFYSFFRTDTKKALQRSLSYPVTFFLSRRCMCVILKTDYT